MKLTLFESIDYGEAAQYLDYKGTFRETLLDLESVFLTTDSPIKLARIAFHSTRLLKAAIDYKIENGHSGIPLVCALQDALLAVHEMDRAGFIEGKNRVLSAVEEHDYEALLDYPVKEPIPEINCATAYDYEERAEAVERLVKFVKGKAIFLLPIGSAGYGSGLDFLAGYNSATDSNSGGYCFRYSVYRCDDKEPRLSSEEIAFIKGSTNLRVPVIFDNFAAEGKTMRGAYLFFEKTFPDKPVVMYNSLKVSDYLTTEEINNLALKDPKLGETSIIYRNATEQFRDRIAI